MAAPQTRSPDRLRRWRGTPPSAMPPGVSGVGVLRLGGEGAAHVRLRHVILLGGFCAAGCNSGVRNGQARSLRERSGNCSEELAGGAWPRPYRGRVFCSQACHPVRSGGFCVAGCSSGMRNGQARSLRERRGSWGELLAGGVGPRPYRGRIFYPHVILNGGLQFRHAERASPFPTRAKGCWGEVLACGAWPRLYRGRTSVFTLGPGPAGPGRFKGLGESRGGKGEIEIPLPTSGPSGAGSTPAHLTKKKDTVHVAPVSY